MPYRRQEAVENDDGSGDDYWNGPLQHVPNDVGLNWGQRGGMGWNETHQVQ